MSEAQASRTNAVKNNAAGGKDLGSIDHDKLMKLVEYFRTGNADVKFNRLDEYVHERLRSLRIKRAGSKLKAGQAERWTRDYFVNGFGLHRLRGTIRYPEAA